MKNRRHVFTILFLFMLTAKMHGQTALCDSIFKEIKEKKLPVSTQSLVLNGDNAFPYNIILPLSARQTESQVVFVFFQDDVQAHSQMLLNFADFMANFKNQHDVSIVLAYGEKQAVPKEDMIYGTQTFAWNLPSPEDYTVIICSLDGQQNRVLTSSRGTVSPSYLTQNAYNAYLASGIGENVPRYYLSQLYSYSFFYDRSLSVFFDAGSPCIKLEFAGDTDDAKIQDTLQNLFEQVQKQESLDWDHHFLLLRVFNKCVRLIETATIKLIILIILVWLIFICTLIFVNIRQKKNAWQAIKNIWYSLPATYMLLIASLFLGRFFFGTFSRFQTDSGVILGLFANQLIISIFVCSAFYIITLFINTGFAEKSVDYLIIICCFINQFVFILVDVSLFPIFMTTCLLSILAYKVKNNVLHICVFFLMIIIFIPYLTEILANADLTDFRLFLLTSNKAPFYISAFLYPIFMIYFRILTSIARNAKRTLTFFITHISFFAVIIIILPVTSSIGAKKLEKRTAKTSIILEPGENSGGLLKITSNEKKIFNDVIHTINISMSDDALQCDVKLSSVLYQPVLYTDNDYVQTSLTKGYFRIPGNPPREMTFSYGSSHHSALLTVTATFRTEKPDVYSVVTQTAVIGSDDE